MSTLRQRVVARKLTVAAASFSAPRLPRPWDDIAPNELPPIIGQALRDRDARRRLGIRQNCAAHLAEALS